MSLALPTPTFRDPAGSLHLEDDRAIRRIHSESRAAALEFVGSAFYARVQQRGDIVGTTIDDAPEGLRFRHPLIPFPTYPWEWTTSQWLAAAELTLNLAQEGLIDGWILKDATPLNILFVGPRPVFVDVLSFERRDFNSSVWIPYAQYVRTFLLPILMNRLLSWPFALTLFKRDGYEPRECYQALNWLQRFSPDVFWPVTLPTWLDKKSGARARSAVKKPQDPGLTAHILKKTFTGLLRRTRDAVPAHIASEWAEYQTSLTHYTADEGKQKRLWVQQIFDEFHPTTVLDIGANTGEYSTLAANAGAQVVALERDAPAADRLFVTSRSKSLDIQTIHCDFARPTPAVGWDNSESTALLTRLEGRFDLVMMLAVIHHLILMEQIPVLAIIAMMHRLTRRHLIVEWVPVSDPMFQSLMRGRESLYGSLTNADLLAACTGLFREMRQETLGNGRTLYLFEKL